MIRRWPSAVALVLVVVSAGFVVLRARGDGSPIWASPPQAQTQALDARAAEIIAEWDRRRPPPARSFVPVAPDTPRWPIRGWTVHTGQDGSAGTGRATSVVFAGPARLPTTRPAPASARWYDGHALGVPLVSAAEAFTSVAAEPCQRTDCDGSVLRLTGARLGAVPLRTAHGWASVPAWLFTVAGSTAQVARVAVDPDLAADPIGPRLQPDEVRFVEVRHGAVAAQEGTAMAVYFLGGPSGDGPCEQEYTAHAVEGASAVVVVVQPLVRRRPAQQTMCEPLSLLGPFRQLTVSLSRPLGERVLLDLAEGLPIMVPRQR